MMIENLTTTLQDGFWVLIKMQITLVLFLLLYKIVFNWLNKNINNKKVIKAKIKYNKNNNISEQSIKVSLKK